MRASLLLGLLFIAGPALADEKFIGSNVDVRTVVSFKISNGAVEQMLPEGWEVNSPTDGPSKGFNLGVVLVHSVFSQDAEGKSLEPIRGAALIVPAKKRSDEAGVMVVSGLMSPSGAPGAYNVFIPATVVIERTVRTGADGTSKIEESWEFKADDGNLIEVQLKYTRGTPKVSKSETKVFSAVKPDFFRIYRVEQGVDVARSTVADTDRVTEFSFKASGEELAPLFDGSEQLISVTSVPWYSRQLYLPAS